MRSVEDALAIAAAGADAIGLNFVAQSPRKSSLAEAAAIATAVRAQGAMELVGLFVDMPADELAALDGALRFDRLQLHGDESPAQCAALGPRVMKALRVASEADLAAAEAYVEAGVQWLLLDAAVPGVRGGSGRVIDWNLVPRLRARLASHPGTHLVLAGGLTPDNVAAAIRAARPDGVDTASGVERAPGVKDPESVRRFVRTARLASEQI